jgi:hyperosmotically inducible periplasmic protein
MTTKYNRSSLWIIIVAAFFAAFHYAGCAGTSTRESTGEYIDDAAITTKVKAAFANDPTVSAIDVKVETFKGTVSLSGFVDTKEQKKQAETVAKGIAGVQKVTNNITVKS